MKQLHVKNHFVPESYLKRWENIDNKIWVYRTLVSNKKVPLWKDYSASAIAYQKHLYTQIIAGNESDELETWFDRNIESPANKVLDRALE